MLDSVSNNDRVAQLGDLNCNSETVVRYSKRNPSQLTRSLVASALLCHLTANPQLLLGDNCITIPKSNSATGYETIL